MRHTTHQYKQNVSWLSLFLAVCLTVDSLYINVNNSTVCTSSISTYQVQFREKLSPHVNLSIHSFIHMIFYFGSAHTFGSRFRGFHHGTALYHISYFHSRQLVHCIECPWWAQPTSMKSQWHRDTCQIKPHYCWVIDSIMGCWGRRRPDGARVCRAKGWGKECGVKREREVV